MRYSSNNSSIETLLTKCLCEINISLFQQKLDLLKSNESNDSDANESKEGNCEYLCFRLRDNKTSRLYLESAIATFFQRKIRCIKLHVKTQFSVKKILVTWVLKNFESELMNAWTHKMEFLCNEALSVCLSPAVTPTLWYITLTAVVLAPNTFYLLPKVNHYYSKF